MEVIALRLEAIALRLEAIATRLEAIATRLEAITTRLEAIASRLEAMAIIFLLSTHRTLGPTLVHPSHIAKAQEPMPMTALYVIIVGMSLFK